MTFEPGELLKQPVTAFVSGDITTVSGTTEPALVFVNGEGDIVAFHGLYEQVSIQYFVRVLFYSTVRYGRTGGVCDQPVFL